jgi:broad specificity phosphatase PhoE
MSGSIILVRHTAVARAWQGRCYGVSDVRLSRAGWAALAPLSTDLAAKRPAWVVHSGLIRTRLLAERVAVRADCPLLIDIDWRERDFGAWEGKTWNAIYRVSGNAMDGMIEAPAEFRPGGGETTCQLAARAVRAWMRLPTGIGVVVTHGGPIAALLGWQRGAPAVDWFALVPPHGATMSVPTYRQTTRRP